MSGRARSLMPSQKIHLPAGRYLPEIIKENNEKDSPDGSFNDRVFLEKYKRSENILSNTRLKQNSSVSSAASYKFQEFYYKTDWPSLSDTGTDSSDCIELGSSGSSASSAFSWADPDGTKIVAEEWEKIQRTLYDEEGPKVAQKHLIEECMQWKQTFPHLRVIGKKYAFPNIASDEFHDTEEEILFTQYECELRLNENLPVHIKDVNKNYNDRSTLTKNRNRRERFRNSTDSKKSSALSLVEDMDSFLRITPLDAVSYSNYSTNSRIGTTSSIIRSEISSSRWRREKNSNSPDFSSLPQTNRQYAYIQQNTRESSAASLYSLASKQKRLNNNIFYSQNNNISISKNLKKSENERFSAILEPIEPILVSRIIPIKSVPITRTSDLHRNRNFNSRNISLPPLKSDDVRLKKDFIPNGNFSSSSSKHRRNKTLTPINGANVCPSAGTVSGDSAKSNKNLPKTRRKRGRKK